ncbi:MAG: PepSY domain-containing protein [Pseudomonadota bacterium]
MTRHPKNKSRAKLLRSLYIWHRYIGLSAALFVVILSVSGLALNHTESLGMDSTHVQSESLLNWYGIHAPDDLSSYSADSVFYTGINELVFRNSRLLHEVRAPLVGSIAYQGFIVIASRDHLTLLGQDGQLIENIGSAGGVPAGMKAIGTTADGAIAIKAAHGYYLTDESFLEWTETDTVEATWSTKADTPPALARALQAAYRGNGLPLERVVLDLHSGRILGNAGVLLVDAATILFLLLALSGIWLWGKRRASARAHRHKLEHQK